MKHTKQSASQKIKNLLNALDDKFLWRVMVYGLPKKQTRKIVSCTGFEQDTRKPINPKVIKP